MTTLHKLEISYRAWPSTLAHQEWGAKETLLGKYIKHTLNQLHEKAQTVQRYEGWQDTPYL